MACHLSPQHLAHLLSLSYTLSSQNSVDRPVTPLLPPTGNQGQPGPYCIPVNPTTGFNVLAAGDSITQGSVPSKNLNHPYTIQLKEVLEPQLQVSVRAVDAGGCDRG